MLRRAPAGAHTRIFHLEAGCTGVAKANLDAEPVRKNETVLSDHFLKHPYDHYAKTGSGHTHRGLTHAIKWWRCVCSVDSSTRLAATMERGAAGLMVKGDKGVGEQQQQPGLKTGIAC